MVTYLEIGRIQTSQKIKKITPAERIFLLLEKAGGKKEFFTFPQCSNFVYTQSKIVCMYDV